MIRRPPRTTRTDTLFPYTTLFRSERQPMFFVATAAADGRINLSPKGYADSFRILSESRVAWLDLRGSGNETHAPLAADLRITLMFCAFNPPAWILRISGLGRPVLPQEARTSVVQGNSESLRVDLGVP